VTESGVYQLEDPAAAKPQNLPSESYAKNIGAINLALSGKAGCCVHPTKVVPRKSQALFVLSIRMRRAFLCLSFKSVRLNDSCFPLINRQNRLEKSKFLHLK
jgi:hypothetical protein